MNIHPRLELDLPLLLSSLVPLPMLEQPNIGGGGLSAPKNNIEIRHFNNELAFSIRIRSKALLSFGGFSREVIYHHFP